MFSRDAKDEIAGLHPERACCATWFVRALALAGRRSHSKAALVTIASERASVARAVIAAAHRVGLGAHTGRRAAAGSASRWTASVALGPMVVRHGDGIELPKRRCCRRAWLRAAFLASGSVSDPSRGYHLEFFCRDDAAARNVSELAAALSVDTGVSRRRGRPIVYVKGADAVSALLGQMGATQAVLRLAGVRAVNQTKNTIRRTVNSEAANAARAAATAARQREAAARAIGRLGLANLSPALREAAQLRIAHPSRTLAELADAARPPITKAAMASRLRLLERLARR